MNPWDMYLELVRLKLPEMSLQSLLMGYHMFLKDPSSEELLKRHCPTAEESTDVPSSAEKQHIRFSPERIRGMRRMFAEGATIESVAIYYKISKPSARKLREGKTFRDVV
ncbi:MAG: hypothetical protein ABIG61_07345 [Planctomycetota bacterium]